MKWIQKPLSSLFSRFRIHSCGFHQCLPSAEYYVSKLHSGQPSKGVAYDDLNYTYQITIADYPVFSNHDRFFSEYEYRDAAGVSLLGGRTKIFFLELTKIQRLLEKSPEDLTKPEKWALYLKFVNDPKRRPIINQLIEEERGLAMASTKLQQITKDDNLRIALFSREKAENDKIARELYFRKVGRAEGIEEGIEKGRQETLEEMARQMVKSGIPLTTIEELTKISLEKLVEF